VCGWDYVTLPSTNAPSIGNLLWLSSGSVVNEQTDRFVTRPVNTPAPCSLPGRLAIIGKEVGIISDYQLAIINNKI
jgi:hypothetical protein